MNFNCLEYLTGEFAMKLGSQRPAADQAFVLQVLVPGRRDCRVHFEVSAEKVQPNAGLAQFPDVTLSIQLPELESMSKGSLDVHEAIILERIQVFGDKSKLGMISAFGGVS